jgi:small subunit ribosomal protein S16
MYYRICVMDARTPRGGKAIEEIGTYDPMIRDTDKRVTLKADRVDYWLGVGAQPTDQVKRLIEKYKGKVPAVRLDVKKPREVVVAPQKAAARRRKVEPPAPPAGVEADAAAASSEAVEAVPAEAATGDAGPAAEAPSEA